MIFITPSSRPMSLRLGSPVRITRLSRSLLYHDQTILVKFRKEDRDFQNSSDDFLWCNEHSQHRTTDTSSRSDESHFFLNKSTDRFIRAYIYTQINEFMSVRVLLHVLSNERRGRRLVGVLRFFLWFRRSRIRRWSFLHGRLSEKILSLLERHFISYHGKCGKRILLS